jgi:hypothetical protein
MADRQAFARPMPDSLHAQVLSRQGTIWRKARWIANELARVATRAVHARPSAQCAGAKQDTTGSAQNREQNMERPLLPRRLVIRDWPVLYAELRANS